MGAWLLAPALALAILAATVAACSQDEIPEIRNNDEQLTVASDAGRPTPPMSQTRQSAQDPDVGESLTDVQQQSPTQAIEQVALAKSPPSANQPVSVVAVDMPPAPSGPFDSNSLKVLANMATRDSRLMLSSLTVLVDETAQRLLPNFTNLARAFTIVVPNDVQHLSIHGVPARPDQSAVEYRGPDGVLLIDASWDTPGLQLPLPEVGVREVDIWVKHGAKTVAYHLRIVRTAPTNAEPPCAANGMGRSEPQPQTVEITSTPVTVPSNPHEYFVLYLRGQSDDDIETPVSVTLGRMGTTTLSERLPALPTDRYRVERFLVADPADIDGDCIDDLTELADLTRLNPLNPTPLFDSPHGVSTIPTRDVFDQLSYHKDQTPDDFAYVKFILLDMETDRPRVYFVNSQQHRYHLSFREAVGLEPSGAGMLSGTIVRHPDRVARNGASAEYHFEFWPYTQYRFDVVERAQTVLAANMPLLEDNLAYYVPSVAIPAYERESASYQKSRVGVVFDENILPELGFVSLNPAEGFGLLRLMDPGERPNPRDIVIYEALPNELPRVAGITTTVPQTPLSHVNLRAAQDGVPNAFIHAALDVTEIGNFVDKYVRYEVTTNGWSMREASRAEVDEFYAASRPVDVQRPQRDLLVTEITPLSEIEFDDWTAFGVKAANLAVLGRLGLPTGAIPDGFAVPFFFYDEFMQHNGFYTEIKSILADSDFQSDLSVQETRLKEFRKLIRGAPMPRWMMDDLAELQASFPEGTSIRCRSSTNNEDLPGFSGAGLYDSRTQHPDEGHIAKCIKQVYASLWNFRAFVERDFHRVDHLSTAMAVLTHPNYSGELANGVAVSFDPVNADPDAYYVNVQVGEDLVTNPMALSVPEEISLPANGEAIFLASSNQTAEGEQIMSNEHLLQFRKHLAAIHEHFEALYNPASDEPFAIEVEFKITADNVLAIKQVRPWIFYDSSSVSPARTLYLP